MVLAIVAAPAAAGKTAAPAGAVPAGTEGFAAAMAQAAPAEAGAAPPAVGALPLANAAARQAALKSTSPSRHGGPQREVAEPGEAELPVASREAEITVAPATGGAAEAKPEAPARKHEPQTVSAFTAMLLGVAAAPAPPASAAATRGAPHAAAPVTQALAAKAVTAQPETAQAAPGTAAAALPGSPAPPIAGGADARAQAPSPFALKLTQAVASVEKGSGPAQPEAVVQPTTQADTELAGIGTAGHRLSDAPTPSGAAMRQTIAAVPLAAAEPVQAPAGQNLLKARPARAEQSAGAAPGASPPNTVGAAPAAQPPPAAANAPTAASPGAGAAPAIPATPAALAAAVTALHQSGSANATLHLDPPGLGQLAIHLALGATGQVNVLFVPSTAQTAQLLHAGMDGLRHAMTQTGLTLGQAQIGGQGSGSQPQQQSAGHQRSNMNAAPEAAPITTGLSAYA